MRTQHYKLKRTNSDFIEVGQFVHRNNEDEEVIGFIDSANSDEVIIMLFEPTHIPDEIHAININEECDYITRLAEIFKENSTMKKYWFKESRKLMLDKIKEKK